MTDHSLDRRNFAKGATALAFSGLAACAPALGNVRSAGASGGRYGALVPDPNGLLDLPAGFSYRIISSMGDRMDDGDTVPDRADGMGCFSGPTPGSVILVRNHELAIRHGSTSGYGPGASARPAWGKTDAGAPIAGGTTNLHVDLASGRVTRQFRSLSGTIRNCAGGQTPWRSWLTCEEDVTKAGRGSGAQSDRDHGWLFEIPADATGAVTPEPLRAMGRFNHEAVAIDPETGIAYLTEDRDDSLLYRFVPAVPGQLARGGQLQVLAIEGIDDMRNWNTASVAKGAAMDVGWIDIDNPESPDDDLRVRGAAMGAAKFARGEGIWFGRRELYFACTSGGAARLGQIFKLRIGNERSAAIIPDRLTLHFESAATDQLNFGDNLTIMPSGDLLVCEDQYGAVVDNHLRIITRNGEAFAFGRIRIQTEPAGVCFSPDGRHLFMNIYSPTKTLMVTGPW
jgi:uncharacterized protein